jgi:parvulin-like peptidyl-prolyl isomerase
MSPHQRSRAHTDGSRCIGRLKRHSLVVAALSASVLCSSVLVTACGDGIPSNVAVQIGHTQITTKTVRHWTAVVKVLESSSPQLSQQRATDFLISAQWIIGQARELSITLTPHELSTQARAFEKRQAANAAEFAQFLSRTGETNADVRLQASVAGLSQKIPGVLEQRYGAPSGSEITRYYNGHIPRFVVPERRDLRILRTPTAAAAVRARREIERGGSFAALAKRQPVAQPIDTHNGLLIGLIPNFFSEKTINDAIFAADPGVLMGPVRISLGYYLFEVVRVHPTYRRTLAEVREEIRRQLEPGRRRQGRHQHEQKLTRLWTERTKCSQSYVIPKCGDYNS